MTIIVEPSIAREAMLNERKINPPKERAKPK
jgi:hypothetical protein